MNKEQFINKHVNLAISQQELDRKWRLQLEEQEHFQWLAEQTAYKQSLSTSTAGGGGNGDPNELTPFILQSWGIGEIQDWSLYRLTTDGNKIPVLNAPPLEGPTVFTKNTLNGLHYYVTYSIYSGDANFGLWDSITGEWQFLEEGTPLLRNLVPATLQYVEGIEGTGNYFIYTDNSQYTGPGTDDIGAKTFRIDLSTPTSFELTELHEWEAPVEAGSFPISTFYQLPVDTEAIPPQDLFQVQEYGLFGSGIPLVELTSINGETYERTYIDLITIDGLPIEAVKVAYILDRTDYNGDTYFNVFASDKINNTPLAYIARFDPASEEPSNLTSIYQYEWDVAPYVTLTTI
jgi:hypothetical protein